MFEANIVSNFWAWVTFKTNKSRVFSVVVLHQSFIRHQALARGAMRFFVFAPIYAKFGNKGVSVFEVKS